MKSKIKYGILFSLLALLPISVFAVDHTQIDIDLACDTLKLKAGESATCTVSLSSYKPESGSEDEGFTGLNGEVVVGNGLQVDSITSLSDEYTVEQSGNNFTVRHAEPTMITGEELVQIKLSAQQDVKVEKSTIQVKVVEECNDWIKGDMNLDGAVTDTDVQTLAEIIGQGEEYTATEKDLALADFNGDQKLTEEDLTYIVKYLPVININDYEKHGDINGDGKLDIIDVQMGIQMVSGARDTTKQALDEADFDGDGYITISDYMHLLKLYRAAITGVTAEGVEGDVDGDGKLTGNDVLQVMWMATGKIEITDRALEVGDLDDNGQITSWDGYLLVQLWMQRIDSVQNEEYQYVCFAVNQNRDGATGTIEFDITPSEEVVDVPDTASNIPVWYYVAGVVFMAFGVYLIVEARRKNQVQ